MKICDLVMTECQVVWPISECLRIVALVHFVLEVKFDPEKLTLQHYR
jgi:hypothetical protein